MFKAYVLEMEIECIYALQYETPMWQKATHNIVMLEE